jgi:hypothetical protein
VRAGGSRSPSAAFLSPPFLGARLDRRAAYERLGPVLQLVVDPAAVFGAVSLHPTLVPGPAGGKTRQLYRSGNRGEKYG